MDECSQYDSDLFYTLRPGQFKFSNREFDTYYYINEIGVRDDSESLNKPEIIVLGDSHAMGWGVEQDSTFASLIENDLHYNVLNSAISSYGTARESILLNKMNTDSLKFLIIQYNTNDYAENLEYYNNNSIDITSKESYLTNLGIHKNNIRYYFSKHIIKISKIIGRKLARMINDLKGSQKKSKHLEIDEFSAFLHVITHGMNNVPDHTKIIVFSIDGRKSIGSFVKGIKEKLEEEIYSNLKKNLILMDFESKLDKLDYYILDDHLNNAGHKVVAKGLENIIITQLRYPN
jgi:hypothetical protein